MTSLPNVPTFSVLFIYWCDPTQVCSKYHLPCKIYGDYLKWSYKSVTVTDFMILSKQNFVTQKLLKVYPSQSELLTFTSNLQSVQQYLQKCIWPLHQQLSGYCRKTVHSRIWHKQVWKYEKCIDLLNKSSMYLILRLGISSEFIQNKIWIISPRGIWC